MSFKGFVDHDVDVVCPTCGTEMDGAMGVTGSRGPKDGDVNVCMYCTEFSTFEGGQLRLLTDKERRGYISDRRLVEARSVARQYLDQHPEIDKRVRG